MTEPRWVGVETAIAIHAEQLIMFGGPAGARDEGLLESALGRPQNKFHYGERDLAVLAAAYAFRLARNHLFIDGNKRAAFAVMMVFLRLNGVPFRPAAAEATAVILALAAGEVDEDGLARWIRDRLPVEGQVMATVAAGKLFCHKSLDLLREGRDTMAGAPNSMEYGEHDRTYGRFMRMLKVGVANCIAIVLALALVGFAGGAGKMVGGLIVILSLIAAAIDLGRGSETPKASIAVVILGGIFALLMT